MTGVQHGAAGRLARLSDALWSRQGRVALAIAFPAVAVKVLDRGAHGAHGARLEHASAVPALVAVAALIIAGPMWLPRVRAAPLRLAALFLTGVLVVAVQTWARGDDYVRQGNDTAYDTVTLARAANAQGYRAFLRTYNDRGNPATATELMDRAAVDRIVARLHLTGVAHRHWIGEQDSSLGRPYLHPPLAFVVLALWMRVAGDSSFSASAFQWVQAGLLALALYAVARRSRSADRAAFVTLLAISLPLVGLVLYFPSYNTLAALALVLGFWALDEGSRDGRPVHYALGGVLLGTAALLEFPAAAGAALVTAAVIAARPATLRRQTGGWALFLLGAALPVTMLMLAGYQPLLTLITAKVRQDLYYAATVHGPGGVLRSLAGLVHVGIPTFLTIAIALLRVGAGRARRDQAWVIAALLLTLAVLLLISRFSDDFLRIAVGPELYLLLVADGVLAGSCRTVRQEQALLATNLALTGVALLT